METDATRTAEGQASAERQVSDDGPTSNDAPTTDEATSDSETTVKVRCTGHVRTAVGEPELQFTFQGTTLREFLDDFFAEYDVKDLLVAETEAEASTDGWADPPEDLPGTWNGNPPGDQTRAYARVAVDGQFNEHLAGLDTTLSDGDRVSLMYPFIFCC